MISRFVRSRVPSQYAACAAYDLLRLDFADAYLVASAERTGIGVVASLDRGIDRAATIRREEPPA